MVPPESFSIEAPHSSIDFCNGCDGGTQCESLSSKVLSCADAAPRLRARPSARPRAIKPPSLIWRVRCMMVLPAGRLLSTRLAHSDLPHLIAENSRRTATIEINTVETDRVAALIAFWASHVCI